ncbi:hypothetical protein ADN00_12980 [Ornatilinea apprima]|uniref:CRISPR type III-associated protein domain-containing protein n=1 Tax=Ornatilinea apprima TaxID=1134406 RepID=A0A0P6X7H1_9CHLR|nr:RAMP superfamily CRISPR-associated protein [Ornatilinea apprima]KPL75299.1 hypothetical protein ADN00_12980 [Ornatilinea apprima]
MIIIKLETKEPLHLSASYTVSTYSPCIEYIPGSALRGGMAKKFLQEDQNQEDFERFFLDDHVRFGPLWPAQNSPQGAIGAILLPMTAYTCKRYPGVYSSKTGYTKHGIRDMLFEFIKEPTGTSSLNCSEQDCEAPLTRQTGYYIGQEAHMELIELDKRVITSTAIDDQTQTAAPEQLFTLQVIEEGQMFWGQIEFGDPDLEEMFCQLCCETGIQIRLGAGTSRGLGLMEVKDIYPSDNHPNYNLFSVTQSLLERIQEFDSVAKMELGDRFANQTCTCFSLDLLSDCLLLDEFLQYKIRIEPSDLARYIHPDLSRAAPLGQVCTSQFVDGWNNLHCLPRETSVAISAGSVFFYCIDVPPQELANLLGQVEYRGIGERTQDGFGRVTINHPFHLKREQR